MKIKNIPMECRSEAIAMLFNAIENGDLRYINQEAGINVNDIIANRDIERVIGKATINTKTTDKDDCIKRINNDILEMEKDNKEQNK